MLFASPRLLQFFQDELGYPEDLLDLIREDFFEAFFMMLEVEINNYLDRHKLKEEYVRLQEIQKKDNVMETDLMQAFLDLYVENPEIAQAVNEKMSYFTKMFLSNIKKNMKDTTLEKMNKIIDEDIARYEKVIKRLTQEI